MPRATPETPSASSSPPGTPLPGADAARIEALREAQDQFIACWGKMGSAWGISRTMAEVHALLYITGEPLCTDDIMERLAISRGNASMSLRSLLDWSIVSRTHRRGDRKEYFIAEQDVWAMFRAIVRERMRRETDPALASLHEIRDLTAKHTDPERTPKARKVRAKQDALSPEAAALSERIEAHHERLDSMLKFFEMFHTLSEKFVSPSGRGLQIAATLLGRNAS